MKKLILLLVLCLSLQVTAFAYSDVTDVELTAKIETLSRYEIINGYEDSTFRPENNITRAEFCKLIMCATLNQHVETEDLAFADVEEGFWAADYIYAARELEVVNGMTETTFAPQANITNEQAVKMIVASLGYSKEAAEAGGYPNGYIEVAKNLGIIQENTFEAKAVSTRADIAEMVYRALDVKFYFIFENEAGALERAEAENTLREIHETALTGEIEKTVSGEQSI